ncbi:MAG: DUF3037 domain-containing protein [Anaerolineae bacterium]|nr:DUF3037 domain-containing protein [Anaerolineae bacterium]MCB0249928.1 DUF3037 domain-containing protein [Anaerolineae bacterium]
MPEAHALEYVVVRVVPRPEREEFINAGVILFCRTLRFLDCRISLDEARLFALAPDVDLDAVCAHLELIPRICAGGPEAGEIGAMDQPERFRWLASPRSTVVQVSSVHGGLCHDPQAALDDLYAKMVAR